MAMPDFTTTLLREKFVLTNVPATSNDRLITAVSNRMNVPVTMGERTEHFIVRAQNMQSCVRMAAHMLRDAQENGLILTRAKPFDWAFGWSSIVKGYEKKWNPQRWIAVYHKGRVVYEEGEAPRHPFLDIIEQCAARNAEAYERSLDLAKEIFLKAGKRVIIEHDSNIALTATISDDEAKFSVAARTPMRTMTFNFIARKKAGRIVKPSQCLSAAAAFLEGTQLTFLIGLTAFKVKRNLIEPNSAEAKQGLEAGAKIGRLNGAIDQFENLLDVTYRPDRPDFTKMIDHAESQGAKTLARQGPVKGAVM